MNKKLNDIGVSFRFITPLLIAVIGWFTIQYLNSIDKKFEKIDIQFASFIESYHLMDKRVDRLEDRNSGFIYDKK